MKIPDYNKKIKHPTYLEMYQEIEILKKLCDEYEEEHNNEFQCWKRDRKELLNKRVRIDKAIEYIETHQLNFKKGTTTFGSERLSMEERKLIDILRGVDKE